MQHFKKSRYALVGCKLKTISVVAQNTAHCTDSSGSCLARAHWLIKRLAEKKTQGRKLCLLANYADPATTEIVISK